MAAMRPADQAQEPEPTTTGTDAGGTWHLYLLRCRDGSLYTGISTNVARRIADHSAGRGARRLRGRGPLELVFSHPVGERGAALRLEWRVKRMSRPEKERLIRGETALPT
jgi:putative endonuclease